MRLESVRVQLFRNVVDSEEIDIDPQVTCFVGKNESGKTALLNALYRLNPVHTSTTFEVSKDYPRWRLSKDRKTGVIEDAAPVSAIFRIEDADRAAVIDVFGEGVLTTDMFGISRHYSGDSTIECSVNHKQALENVLEKLETPPLLRELFAGEGLAGVKKLAAGSAPPESGDWTAEDLANVVKEATTLLNGNNTAGAVAALLQKRLPKFFYFSDYQALPGRIDIAQLQGADVPGETGIQTARALLKLASTDAASLTEEEFEDRKAELEAVSNELTEEVLEYWKQNTDLSVEIDLDKKTIANGYNGQTAVAQFLDVRVRDARHGFTNNFDQRSSGFKWFFSFLAAFSEFEDYEHGVIVLLDEPALTLHGRAQADFLRYIDERLAASAQVVFTTHSPFMVNPTKLDKVRIIEDKGAKRGSVATRETLAVGNDSLFPLQAALGYDIAQNLFIGSNNLVVEGTSDYTYLSLLTDHLKSLGREGLDAKWRILPAGGAANIPSFVALIGQGLDVTTLVDGGPSAQTKLQNLADKGLLEKNRIFVTDHFTEGISPSDIEDLFDEKDYFHLYNLAFGAKLTKASAPGADRIVARISRATKGPFLDHGRPADYLLRHKLTQLPKLSETTLKRFESLCKAVNKTLG
ncbi:ATP-dependent nuclease [Pseudarthrobacter oxydans]|uniref:ATP-dependent nuclease n=1 Tax=Pseudarthrobacter oxydans TaxID=1671 RepID=UPI00343E8334